VVAVAVGVVVAVVVVGGVGVAVVMKPIASRLPDFSQPTELSILQQRVRAKMLGLWHWRSDRTRYALVNNGRIL